MAKEEQDKKIKIKELAHQGDAQAQFEEAKLYLKRDPENNFKEALKWLGKAAAQGHREAERLKTQIENEKLYFSLVNNTAFEIVEISVFNDKNNTHNWRGRLSSSLSAEGRGSLAFSLTKGECIVDSNILPITVHYTCNARGLALPAIKDERIFIDRLLFNQEREENSPGFPGPCKIYLDYKFGGR
jgi:hypothetical protein